MSELSQDQLLNLVNSKQIAPGSDRVRALTQRIVSDLFHTIDERWMSRPASSGPPWTGWAALGAAASWA